MQGAKIVTFFIHLIYTFAPSVSQIYLVSATTCCNFYIASVSAVNCVVIFPIKICNYFFPWLKNVHSFTLGLRRFPAVISTTASSVLFSHVMIGSFYNCVCSDWLTLLSHLFSRALHLLPVLIGLFLLSVSGRCDKEMSFLCHHREHIWFPPSEWTSSPACKLEPDGVYF